MNDGGGIEAMAPASLEAAMAAVADGDPAAGERVFAALLPMLQRMVHQNRTLSYQERCDMISQVSEWLAPELTAVCLGFDTGRGPARPYLRQVLRRKIIRYLRHMNSHKHRILDQGQEDVEEDGSSQPDGEALLKGVQLHAAIRTWVAGRNGLDQLIFEERILGDTPSLALAEALGIQRAVVDTRVNRLRSGLEAHLVRYGLLAVLCGFWML